MTAPQTLQLHVGMQIGDCTLGRPIGQGGFGEVYAAEGPRGPVAVKIMSRLEGDLACRFQDEARLMARIDSPYVVRIYEIGHLPGGWPYLIMEHIAGGSLSALLERGALAPEHAAKIAADVLIGLDAAHRQGVIHRDIKPSNVLLDHAGDRALLCDFGIARSASPMHGEAPATGRALLGTLAYVAPERLVRARDGSARREDPRSDLYSVGVILYRMLSGRRPFEAQAGDPVATVRAKMLGKVPLLPDHVPIPLASICMRLMAMRPEDRYPSAQDAFKDLARTWARMRRTEVMPMAPLPPADDAATLKTPPPAALLECSEAIPLPTLTAQVAPDLEIAAPILPPPLEIPEGEGRWWAVAALSLALLGLTLAWL